MQCGYPYDLGGRVVPCGRCMPCRINTKRMWTGRILLESKYSKKPSSFLTLTYSDINVPRDGQLEIVDFQGFIKNVRNSKRSETIRFFGVGEYGDKYGRPHYHCAMFNLPPEENEKIFNEAWGNGFTHVGEITSGSAAYIASYTTKKLTKAGDDRLEGKSPEFARMSKYPPIGQPGIEHIQSLLETRTGAAALADQGDVPAIVRIGGKQYPIGKYWRGKLREYNGIYEPPDTSQDWEIDSDEQAKAEKIAAKLFHTKNKTWKNNKVF